MSRYSLPVLVENRQKFAPSRVHEPLARLPSIPHVAFGAFNFGAPDEEAEQGGLLYSIEDAGDRYRMVSLGAAPGEWAIKAERAHRWKYPEGDFRAWCIEGDKDHVDMIHEFMDINGADPGVHDVRYAVIAEKDGYAYFPIINPTVDWGAGIAALADDPEDLDNNITISERAAANRIQGNGGKPLEYRTVSALSLATLLGEIGRVDYLHCDVQGAEQKIFPLQMDAMNAHVRLASISTHGKDIEADLRVAFAREGWVKLADYTCGVSESGDVVHDGVMIYSNPRVV